MAVETIYAEVEEAGNDVKLAFDFSFKILAQADLVVRKKAADGSYSAPLTLGSDYTVTFDPEAETGTVTYAVAPVTGGASNIGRSTPPTQESVLTREGPLPVKTLETMVDKLTLLVQEILAVLTPIKVGSFDAIDAGAGALPFLAILTDRRTIQLYLGNRSLGVDGWAVLGGF
jgi:hypothetical protein